LTRVKRLRDTVVKGMPAEVMKSIVRGAVAVIV
jgi:hypothetical protein